MSRRIFWAIFSASFLSFLLSIVFCFYFLQKEFERDVFISMQNQARYIQAILHDNPSKLADIKTPVRLSVIDSRGNVIYDSFADPSKNDLGNHENRPEVMEAMKSGEGFSHRFSVNLNKQTYYYALRLNDHMILRLANNQDHFVRVFFDSFHWWIGLLGFSVLFCLFLVRILSRLIISPLESINFKSPSDNLEIYPEFRPFLDKITKQEKLIRKQLNILRQKNREVRAITQNMQECFIVLNRDLKVISFNKKAKALFKNIDHYQSLDSIFHQPKILKVATDALHKKRCECDISLDGAHYQILASALIHKVKEDKKEKTAESKEKKKNERKAKGVILFILDITEKKERENLRREFSANVSHELKTPLTSISGYAELLKNNLVCAEDVSEFGNKIQKQSQRLLDLINDIMKISELDEGNHSEKTMVKEKINLSSSVSSILEQLPTQGLHIDVEGEGEVYGVKTLIEDMIFNLCENAIKYNRPNGSIHIRITESTLSIEDSGIGIAKENQKRVFERFFREDKSHSQKIEGTGLGLSIVKHIASLHHFDIKLKSKVGKGTKITISW